MLAVNDLTRKLLVERGSFDAAQVAERMSDESVQRYLLRMNSLYKGCGVQFEYIGGILRCVVTDDDTFRQLTERREERLISVDPWAQGSAVWLQNQSKDCVVWWYDLGSLQTHYSEIRSAALQLLQESTRDQVASLPIVIGADWEFNAWACPAGDDGSFIMVNLGFMQARLFAAMFFEIFDEFEDGTQTRSLVATSSMLWMAAQVLGIEQKQWDNLALPATEYNRIWENVQHPQSRLSAAMRTMDAFAILHECGHIVKDHLRIRREWPSEATLTPAEKIERYRHMRDLEFEADAFACEALRSIESDGAPFIEGLFIVFLMLHICEDVTSHVLTMTHPNASDRFRRCLVLFGGEDDVLCASLERFALLFKEAARERLRWQESSSCRK